MRCTWAVQSVAILASKKRTPFLPANERKCWLSKRSYHIDLTLTPFGLRESDGCFVDVAHVERGRKCGCICPSCKTPLIARQGEQKQWHFAHASRSVYAQTDNDCEYSFFISVRMMARQVIGNSLEILLPPYEAVESLFIDELGEYITERFVVTDKKRVKIEDIEIEKEIFATVVDVYGTIDGYPFVMYFSHPGREVPIEFESLSGEKCGIVEVSLGGTYSLFAGERDGKQTYLEKLRHFLIANLSSKRWVYHPRYSSMLNRARHSLKLRHEELLRHQLVEHKSPPSVDLGIDSVTNEAANKAERKRKVRFQCLMCDTTWIGLEPGYSACPNCKTHLFGKRLGYTDTE